MWQHPSKHDSFYGQHDEKNMSQCICSSFLVQTLYTTDQIHILCCICWLQKRWHHCHFVKSRCLLSFIYFTEF